MGRIRFKLWLHKLREMKIKGLHRRRLTPPPSLCNDGAISLLTGHALLCCSSRSVETHSEVGFAESRSCLCPGNLKSLDTSFPASPNWSPLILSPRLSPRSISFLSSHIVDPCPCSSPNCSNNKVIATNVTVRSQNASALDCGCKLASSVRKVKERFHTLSVGKAFDGYRKHSKKGGKIVDKKKRRSVSKAALTQTVGTQNTVEKFRGKRSKSIKAPDESSHLCPPGGTLESHDRCLQTFSISETHTVNSKFEKLRRVEGIDCSVCSYRLSNCSIDATLDSCPCAYSISSDDFFLSSEKGQASNSSNSSSEFLEKSLSFSMDSAPKDARTTDQSLLDDYVLGAHKSISEEAKEYGNDGEKDIGQCLESFKSRKNRKVRSPSAIAMEEVLCPATNHHYECKDDKNTLLSEVMTNSHETSTRSFDANEQEANSKAWTECSAPGMINQEDDSEYETDETILISTQALHRDRQRKARKIFKERSGGSLLPCSSQSCIETLALSGTGWNKRATQKGKVYRLQDLDLDGRVRLPGLSFALKGRVCDSVAVVKASKDPYLDFRDSMVDMILEKQIFKSSDLEQLLQCFLSLNSLEHHGTIVRAFTQVWDMVFGSSTARSPLSSS